MYDKSNNLGGGSLISNIAVSDDQTMPTPLSKLIENSSHNIINEVVGLRLNSDTDIHVDVWSLTDSKDKSNSKFAQIANSDLRKPASNKCCLA